MHNLEEWVQELRSSKTLKIVEGKKDKEALSDFGITNIFTLNKPLYKIVVEISEHEKEVILLLDLDKEGKKLYSYLKRNFERNGIKVVDKFRLFLFNNTKISNIEGIRKYLRDL